MIFTEVINEAFKYYKITDNFIESGSLVLKNSNFVDTVINEVNFTTKSFGLDERLERGFNVNSVGDYVVISPFKKRGVVKSNDENQQESVSNNREKQFEFQKG